MQVVEFGLVCGPDGGRFYERLYLYREIFLILFFQKNLSKLTVIEKAILEARIKGRSIGRIGPLYSFLCISGLQNRIKYLNEVLFPNKEVVNKEFAAFRGPKRILFYPFRIIQAMIIISKRFTEILVYTFRGK